MVARHDDEDYDEDFEAKYDAMFGSPKKSKIDEFDRDAITGRRSKKPKMSILNKSKVSKQELDDLFL
jgi:hypothetical protein